MVVEVIFPDCFLLALLYWLVHGRVRRWLHHWLRHPARATPSKACAKEKPFPGLTRKPHCAACEAAAGAHPPPPPAPPPPVIQYPRGRPREVDTCNHYCPNTGCEYFGWIGRGNIRANGFPNGRRWRQLHCVVCNRYFLETHGTLFHGKSRPAEDILRAIAAVAEGLGIRAVARVFETQPNTVLSWLIEAAVHAETISQYLLHDLRVSQIQLDELFARVSAVAAEQPGEAEAIERLSRSPRWVWTAIDPVSKLWLAVQVGDRTQAMAQQLVHQVVERLASHCRPLFITDGFKEYATALLTHFGQWVQPSRRQATGPAPKPRWLPQPSLLYAQVIKKRRRRRLVHVTQRIVYGTLARAEQLLRPTGWGINTAFVERLNLTIRQHVAAIGRRVITIAKSDAGLHHQLSLFQLYYNVCLPHDGLRKPRSLFDAMSGCCSPPRWQARTPAMAAGVTDHVWSLREALLLRVPPWPQPALE
jgi:IS1 family transposase/transposase-like protein